MKYQKQKRFEINEVKFSKKDVKKDIRIPLKLNEQLAEDLGIHIGDGSLYKHGTNGHYEFSYSGNILEKEYIHHVIRLKKELYNISKIRKYVYGNEFRVNFNSLAIATFYSKILGIPVGSKKDIDVPKVIKESKDKKIISSFIRGLVDTDFCFVFKGKWNNPVLQAAFTSSNLVISLKKLFEILGIKSSIILNYKNFDKRTKKYYLSNYISVAGKKNVPNALRLIKPKNPKYKNKIKKYGPAGI